MFSLLSEKLQVVFKHLRGRRVRIQRMVVRVSILLALTNATAGDAVKQTAPSKALMKAAFNEAGWPRGVVTDVSLYGDILRSGWVPAVEAKIFPATLPRGARMAFFPAFLQGGGFLQIAEPATENEINALEKRFARYKRLSDVPGEDGKGGGLAHRPSRFIPFNPGKYIPFPSEHDVIMLMMKASGGKDIPWDSGMLAGVAFDRKEGLIFYWAEWW